MSNESTVIGEIAGLWKLGFVILIGGLATAFRTEIKSLLTRVVCFKLKRGETELIAEAPGAMHRPLEGTAGLQKQERQDPQADQAGGIPQAMEFGDVYNLIKEKKFAEANIAFEKYSKTIPSDRVRDDLIIALVLRHEHGDEGALYKLRGMLSGDKSDGYVKLWIARCLKISRKYEEATATFTEIIDGPYENSEKASALINKATIIAISDQLAAIKFLSSALSLLDSSEAKADVYGEISKQCGMAGDKTGAAMARERQLELSRSPNEVTFDAAYAQAEAGFHHIALSNYSVNVISAENPATAQNNLAVACGELGMKERQFIGTERVPLGAVHWQGPMWLINILNPVFSKRLIKN